MTDLRSYVADLRASINARDQARRDRLARGPFATADVEHVAFGPERLTLTEHKRRADAYVRALVNDDAKAALLAYADVQPLGAWWRSWSDRLLFVLASPIVRGFIVAAQETP